MEIYLLRHGIAEDAKAGQSDSSRALTSEGREKLERVLHRAAKAGVKPSLILSSPLLRAMQTAEVAKDVLGYDAKIVQTEALTPHASPAATRNEIRERRSESAVILASHEPLMSALAAFLLRSPGLQVDMKKAALVRMDCDRFGAEPSAVLKWMLTPGIA